MRFSDTVTFITGAGSGIGAATARLIASKDASYAVRPPSSSMAA